jgi:hypothetical protein
MERLCTGRGPLSLQEFEYKYPPSALKIRDDAAKQQVMAERAQASDSPP